MNQAWTLGYGDMLKMNNLTKLTIFPDNNEYVFSKVGNRLFQITKELDNELIEKSIKHKKEIKLGKGKIPRQWLYGLWANLYSVNGYKYYLDPINFNIYETKLQKWRVEFIRILLSYLTNNFNKRRKYDKGQKTNTRF